CPSACVSPSRSGSDSTNIGTMTSGHPWRISDRVPSKSNRTWLISARGSRGRGSSTLPNEPVPFSALWLVIVLAMRLIGRLMYRSIQWLDGLHQHQRDVMPLFVL